MDSTLSSGRGGDSGGHYGPNAGASPDKTVSGFIPPLVPPASMDNKVREKRGRDEGGEETGGGEEEVRGGEAKDWRNETTTAYRGLF